MVEFAVGGERQGGEPEPLLGHVVEGQSREQFPAEFRFGNGFEVGLADQIGDQDFVPCGAGSCQDRGLRHRRVLAQLRFDFRRLDAESAELELLVDAALVLDRPVRQPAAEIAGAIESAEWRLNETLGGQFGPAQVAERHARSADVDFAGQTGGHEAQPGIEKKRVGIRDGPADRHSAVPHFLDALADRESRGLPVGP